MIQMMIQMIIVFMMIRDRVHRRSCWGSTRSPWGPSCRRSRGCAINEVNHTCLMMIRARDRKRPELLEAPPPTLFHIRVCVYMCVYIYIYTSMYVYMYTYIYIYIYIYNDDTVDNTDNNGNDDLIAIIVIETVGIKLMLLMMMIILIAFLIMIRSISEISSCIFGPRPWHIEIRHRVKKSPQLICSDLRLSNWKSEDWNYGNRP